MPLTLRRATPKDLPAFTGLLARYFRQELQLPLTDGQAAELAADIMEDTFYGVPLTLAMLNGTAVGFINYQIDTPGGSWCFHPGWGCIRECYVAPEHRKSGIAAALVRHASTRLARAGAGTVYLTADTAIPFWRHLGYAPTGRTNDKNGLEELEKKL